MVARAPRCVDDRRVKTYALVGADGKKFASNTPGTLGGAKKTKLYGRLDCPSALRAIARGPAYKKNRVFFADEATAKAAGFRPCSVCLPGEYEAWQREQEQRAAKAALAQHYGIAELSNALIDAERWASNEKDRAYYGAQRDAFLRAFGLSERKDEARYALKLVSSTARCLYPLRTPFEGMMEAPRLVNELYQEHGPGLRAAKEEFANRLEALLRATLERAVPKNRQITGADLLANGFDPGQPDPHPPVSDDDW